MTGTEEQAPSRVVAGRYRLESVLGRGGMGVVWRATDTLIERTVALKELRSPAGEESFVERALREARNAGRLNHPGIVAVHDVIAPSDDDTAVYIVMEYVEAPSLADVIDQQGPLPPARVAALGLGILDALMAAHAIGIVHRDVKPANVLIGDGDRVKLTDFGIALAAEDSRLTRTGVMGTHAYLAPECFDAGQVGPATDLWALGATLFHAVAGRPPFDRDTTTATLRAILLEEPPPPPCGPPLAEVISGLLTRAVDQRLTGATARPLLQDAASTMPTVEAPPTVDPGSPSGWQAQPTTHHRAPTGHPPTPFPTPLLGPPSGRTTQPGGPPSPFATAQHPQPPQGPQGPHGSGPAFAQPSGGPPAQRNNTPLVFGVLAAVAAVVLIVVLASSGGGDNDGQEAGDNGNGAPTDLSLPPASSPGGAAGTDTTTVDGPTTTNSQGCCDGGEGAKTVAQDLLLDVNDGDDAGAKARLCDPADGDAFEISDAISRGASLHPDTTTVDTGGGNQYSVSLLGLMDDEPITTGHVSAIPNTSGDGWCVDSFFVG